MKLVPIKRLFISMLCTMAVAISVTSCVPDNDDDNVIPAPAPPTVKSRSTIIIGNFITPAVLGSNMDIGYRVTAKNALGNSSGNVVFGSATVRTLEWFGSDSAEGRVGINLTQVGTPPSFDLSGLYSRTRGHWIFTIGSLNSRFAQTVRTLRFPYYTAPADTNQRRLVYLNADPSHAQVRVLYNSTLIGTVAYGDTLSTRTAFNPVPGDRIIAVNANNANDTIMKTDIGLSLKSGVNVVGLIAYPFTRLGRDTVAYRHVVFGQE